MGVDSVVIAVNGRESQRRVCGRRDNTDRRDETHDQLLGSD